MAAAEIKLPPEPQETSPAVSPQQKEGQDLHRGDVAAVEKRAASDEVDGELLIVYHYLTFDTELPLPSTSGARDQDDSSLDQPPDLSRFGNPLAWSKPRKDLVIYLSCTSTMVTAYTAGSYAAGSAQMSAYFNVSQVAISTGITVFTTGFAMTPMVLAPFSELNGRRPVFVATGILFVICQLCCAVTRSFGGMLAARFFAGAASSTFSSMVGGVISDIYSTKDRNTPMALFAGFAFFGTGLGPLVSGLLAQHLLWRWIFYVQVMTCGFLMLLLVIFFKETRGSVLLSRRGHALNTWYEKREKAGHVGVNMPNDDGTKTGQRIRWRVKADEERESLGKMIGISVYRPFHLLVTEPVVFFFSLWVAFSWAILYMTFSAVPFVFTTNHGFNIEQNGAVFTAMCVGSILSTILSVYQEKIAKHYGKMSFTPEGRLYFTCIESALLPIGLFWFGWTQFSTVHWIVPSLAIGCATMGIFSVYLAAFNYLADTYHRYASSAIAAQSFCRNMLGGVFPVIVDQMFHRMTFAGASSFLGAVGAVLTLIPYALVFYGPRIRARSKFASEIVNESQS